MKRIMLLALVLMLTVVNGWAVPARPGLWKTIVTPQGEKLSVQLCGDERGCFWMSNDGRRFVEKADGSYLQASLQELAAARSKSRLLSSQSAKLPISQSSRLHLKGSQPVVEYLGKKKGLIILAEFQNKHFLPEHDRAYFERVANERGFSEGDYRGSVKDYFLSQSDSLGLTADQAEVQINWLYQDAESGDLRRGATLVKRLAITKQLLAQEIGDDGPETEG